MVSPNTNTVGDGEKSKPSPGSQDIFLDRDNSRAPSSSPVGGRRRSCPPRSVGSTGRNSGRGARPFPSPPPLWTSFLAHLHYSFGR